MRFLLFFQAVIIRKIKKKPHFLSMIEYFLKHKRHNLTLISSNSIILTTDMLSWCWLTPSKNWDRCVIHGFLLQKLCWLKQYYSTLLASSQSLSQYCKSCVSFLTSPSTVSLSAWLLSFSPAVSVCSFQKWCSSLIFWWGCCNQCPREQLSKVCLPVLSKTGLPSPLFDPAAFILHMFPSPS